MYETGIYDLSQFYDSKFFIGKAFENENKRISVLKSKQKTVSGLDQFKSSKQNKCNIIYTDLSSEHFKLAIEFWFFSFSVSFIYLISEIFSYSVKKCIKK